MKKNKIVVFASALAAILTFSSCQKIKNIVGVGEPKKDVGLVLSGGGAKGAYQIGVWRALEERGIAQRVKTVSGTSVGALNAALFATCTRREAEDLWRKDVGFYSFLMPDVTSFSDIVSYVKKLCDIYSQILEIDSDIKSDNGADVLKNVTTALSSIFTATLDLTQYVLGSSHSDGLFTRDALSDILKQYITLKKIKDSGVTVYVSSLEKNFLDFGRILSILNEKKYVKYFNLAEQVSDQNIHKLLLASSALPVAYPSELLPADIVYEGKKLGYEAEYIDGGFDLFGGANTPCEPVTYDPQIKTVIVVYLQSLSELGGEKKLIKIDQKENVINIVPSKNLGTIISGTVNFMNDKIDSLMQLGYEDAIAALEDAGL